MNKKKLMKIGLIAAAIKYGITALVIGGCYLNSREETKEHRTENSPIMYETKTQQSQYKISKLEKSIDELTQNYCKKQ